MFFPTVGEEQFPTGGNKRKFKFNVDNGMCDGH